MVSGVLEAMGSPGFKQEGLGQLKFTAVTWLASFGKDGTTTKCVVR